MKPALKISILINLMLLACLLFALSKVRNAGVVQMPPTAAPQNTSVAPGNLETKPFRWSQLESTNYLTYIQNLREVGCPEQTVRDIVTADVESLYRSRAQRLRQQWTADAGNSPAGLRAELQKLNAEKSSVIARLLGPDAVPVASVDAAMDSPAPQNSTNATPVSLPLVWQNVDPAKLKLDSDQMEAIAQLRQSFMDKIGGANQDPNSPEYRARWQKAQPEIDDALAGLVGRKEFLQYQALAPQAGNK